MLKPKRKAIGRTGKDGTKSVKIRVEVKYLSNFWRTLEKPWINCEKNLTLTWSNLGFFGAAHGGGGGGRQKVPPPPP